MPDWDAISKKQLRAQRAMYDPMEVAEWDRQAERQVCKREFLDLLRTDAEFREHVRKILKEDK